MSVHPYPSVTGVILAGGRARRMGGDDKGLLPFRGRPLVSHALDALRPQVDNLIINANRNADQYRELGCPVVADSLEGFQGPLAGMLTALEYSRDDYVLTAPCDSPFLTPLLRRRMMETLLAARAAVAVASDGERLQPVFCLISRELRDDLHAFLQQGGRKIDAWLARQRLAEVDLSDQPQTFINCNSPEDLLQAVPLHAPKPLLGLAAYSGTGKTTLLTALLPLLSRRGIRVGVIKHAHHLFDIDQPGKDSYQLREAGAREMLIASRRLMALMHKRLDSETEPALGELLGRLDSRDLDLILVEGFKDAPFAKIELHRTELGKPLLFPRDPHIIAIASNGPVGDAAHLDHLDLDDINAFADYIEQFIHQWST